MNLFARIAALVVIGRALRESRKRAEGEVVSSETGLRPPISALKHHRVSSPSSPGKKVPTGADAADTPLDLEAADWKQTAKRTLKEVKEDRVTLIAAGMAYYMFLAIFPAIIALVGILGLVHAPGVADTIRETVTDTLPGGAGEVLASAFRNPSAPPESAALLAAIFGIAAALWSASSGFVALQSGLNIAYEIDEDRKFLAKRGVALLLLLLTLLLGGVPSPIFTFGESAIFMGLGWILTVLAVIVLFSSYYAIGPKKRSAGWQWVSPGGLVGAGIWIVASFAFSLYANLGSYNKTYGALAGVIVLIFWLYLSSVAILIGGELNSELERQTDAKPSLS